MNRTGSAIRIARMAHGLSAKDLAARTGLSQQYISEVQRGTRVPPVETLLLIARALPNADRTALLWRLLRDSWGPEIVREMLESLPSGADGSGRGSFVLD